jgi:hypothetical protein
MSGTYGIVVDRQETSPRAEGDAPCGSSYDGHYKETQLGPLFQTVLVLYTLLVEKSENVHLRYSFGSPRDGDLERQRDKIFPHFCNLHLDI